MPVACAARSPCSNRGGECRAAPRNTGFFAGTFSIMASPFVFSLSGLEPGSRPHPVRLEVPVAWSVESAEVASDPPLTVDLTLEAVPGGVVVRGSAAFVTHETCHRCLKESEVERTVQVAALFQREPLEDDDYVVEGDAIDLEQMLRDEVLLSLPMVPRCSDDCGGVVTTPESGLNTDPPGDDPGEGSPFAVLRDLLPGEDERNEDS